MNASSINPLFHAIDLSTTTGIKIFINAIIGLDDKEKYDGTQDSIMKHLQSSKYQGVKYGWSDKSHWLKQPLEFIYQYTTVLA